MLNVAVNYREHALEMAGREAGRRRRGRRRPGTATPERRAPQVSGSAQPDDARWNPYMFLKAPGGSSPRRSDPVPPGRTQIDWECELGVVIGRTASRVPVARRGDYIFGYTLEHDVSDRQGRGDNRYGTDWLIGKSHDTFAPMGPFIVPKEFVARSAEAAP